MHKFKVQGSTGLYDVVISKEGTNLRATCTCLAGQNAMACKHRNGIFYGSTQNILKNKEAVLLIPEFIKDTTEGLLMADIFGLEIAAEDLKKEISEKKKLLGKLFLI